MIMLTLVLFEDAASRRLYPLQQTRPVCDLVSGLFSFYERLARLYPENKIEILCRQEMRAIVRESGRTVFDEAGFAHAGDYAFINARAALLSAINPEPGILIEDDTLIYLRAERLAGWCAADFLDGSLSKARALGLPELKAPHHIYNYLWEISCRIGEAMEVDIACLVSARANPAPDLPGVIIMGDRVYISPDAAVDPGCILDARAGAIVIKSGARISQRSVITGAACIGEDAIIDGARIHNAYIGRGCRVGGEVAESVLLDWSNKHHDGFLGHAYLGSWVNIGALTTNSDLRNDYKPVRPILEGKRCPDGAIKLGCLIGDHAKLGIGLLLNTGLVIGAGVNLYFDGALFSGEVPPFVWGGRKPYAEYRLNEFLATAECVMSRRGLAMGAAMRERLSSLHAESRKFREGFLDSGFQSGEP
jgi:UDP-N-acetylglucosamine diphosphorylase/glucosamine-1-phosphate N-acetyltransferase